MRKLLTIIGAVVLVAACACAEPRHETISVSTTTNDNGTATATDIAGYIDEIVLETPIGSTSTGTVAVTATPPIGSAVTLASKTISATALVRLRVDGTDTAGSALTNDPPGRYLSYGDTITVAVTSAAPTGLTWRVWIKYDDTK